MLRVIQWWPRFLNFGDFWLEVPCPIRRTGCFGSQVTVKTPTKDVSLAYVVAILWRISRNKAQGRAQNILVISKIIFPSVEISGMERV